MRKFLRTKPAPYHHLQRRKPLPPVVYIYTPFFPSGRVMPVDVALTPGRKSPGGPMVLAVSQLPGVCAGLRVAAVSLPVP